MTSGALLLLVGPWIALAHNFADTCEVRHSDHLFAFDHPVIGNAYSFYKMVLS